MSRAEIEELFRSLQLETDEQRAKMRFEPMIVGCDTPVQVFTTDSTRCQTKPSEPEDRIA